MTMAYINTAASYTLDPARAYVVFFFFQAEDGIRDGRVTGFRRVLFRSPGMIHSGDDHVGPGERVKALLAREREIGYQGLLGLARAGGGRCDHRSSSADDLGGVLI